MCCSRKELRIWLNWFFTLFLGPYFTFGQFGYFSAFHQFVINPTQEEINATGVEIEPGLGQSEAFYSILVSVTSFGSLLSGVLTGIFMRSIPFWYLWVTTLILNIIAFLIQNISLQPWLIFVARLLSGYSLGAAATLCMGYMTISSKVYVDVRKELGKEITMKDFFKLRDLLLALVNLMLCTGFLIGAVLAVFFAQFESVDQFRIMGWLILAYSAFSLCLLLLIFHGEMKCERLDNCFQLCPKEKKESSSGESEKLSWFSLFVIISLFMLAVLERARFGFVLTLFNPVGTDSFGIDERGSSYLNIPLGIFELAGALLLILLRKLKISNQAICLLGMFTTMLGYVIVADWQTIPYDPCTEYSPFHHPNLTKIITQSNMLDQLPSTSGFEPSMDVKAAVKRGSVEAALSSLNSHKLAALSLQYDLEIHLGTGSTISYQADIDLGFSCKQVKRCDCNQLPSSTRCLEITLGNKEVVTGNPSLAMSQVQELYQCSSRLNTKVPIMFCVVTNRESQGLPKLPYNVMSIFSNTTTDPMAEINSLVILPTKIYEVAKKNCIEANVTGHQCHWLPSSKIFKKECKDCPAICRSVHQTLTFPQFTLGNGLLIFSSAIQSFPVISLLLNQSPPRIQGVVVGLVTAMFALSRTVSSLIFDAVYEVMQKRTFLLCIVLAILHIPFIIEIIVLYPKLGPKVKEEDKNHENDEYKYTKLKSADEKSEE